MNEPKGKANGCFFIIAVILAVLAIPATILSYVLYFAWDSQTEGNPYKIAFEKDGKLYELSLQGSSLAFDSGTDDDRLYLNSPHYLADLIAFGYEDYKTENTENPYFAGTISSQNRSRYSEREHKFLNAKDSVAIYKFFDQSRNLIYTYEQNAESDFVRKLRPAFPAFSKRKYGIGSKREYLDVTGILKAKLNKSLKFRIDEANKLLILRFE